MAGPAAQALAVYAEPDPAQAGRPYLLRPAQDQGFEGVACVDDAARGVVLYGKLWQHHAQEPARVAASRLLRFLAYMQEPDGRFANFIVDWRGEKNLVGATSAPGGPPWQARALHALAWAIATFGDDEEWHDRFRRALPWVHMPSPYLDVRAVAVLAVLQHWQSTGAHESAERALAWADEIASVRDGDRLLDAAGVPAVHLWGHLQETALADTGRLLARPDLVECARASAEALLLPAVDWCHTASGILPFDVSCVISGLTAVGLATRDARYTEAAVRARSWFLGHNSAHSPVYDRELDLFYDGIDQGAVNRNSGAESNIEGSLALFT